MPAPTQTLSVTDRIAREQETQGRTDITREDAIAAIRAALKRRSGKTWSVTGGRGTAWGWLTIQASPARRDEFGAMTDEDRTQLAELLGLERIHHQGVSVPAGIDYRIEYIARAEHRAPSTRGVPYWD
jgi:hypothetical protein